ncbi:MAG: hypothetical protein JW768_02590 [Chitinispirillaceae bacterium]|nr:hypothetical protein [Chitinispirillaceae bacterium]
MRSGYYLKMIWSMVFLGCFSGYAMPIQDARWRLLGLEDRSINCILADDTSMILVGTSKGMSVYWNSGWFDFDLALPVTSIARLSNDMIFVGAGNGSRSDAVYMGKKILKGPPFYQMRFQHYFLEPAAMVINNAMAIARLFVGGRNIVSVGMIGNDTLLDMRPITVPEYPFGVEMPYCSDILIFSGSVSSAYSVFAGGYDKSPEPGQGSLLELDMDSLIFHTLRKLDVTALAQGSFEEGGPELLVVGTRDAGILLYNPSSQTSALLPGPGKLPINDVITVPNMIFSDILVAACDSGVYANNGRAQTWAEIGSIPAPPLCLAPRGTPADVISGALLAGTAKGVYIYDIPAGIAAHSAQKGGAVQAKPIFSRNGDVRIRLEGSMLSFATITVYTASGKVHTQIPAASGQARFRLEAKGIYLYDCIIRGIVMRRGVICFAQ